MIMDKAVPGKPLPAVTFPLLDGGEFSPGHSGGWELLVVYRGQFCPRCKKYLATLDGLRDRLQAAGVALHVVSADSPEEATVDRTTHGWQFPLGHSLSVDDMRKLGLYVTTPDPSSALGLPYAEPGVFFTTPDGVLQIVCTSNAASFRPDLDVLVDGVEATIAKGMPIRGLM